MAAMEAANAHYHNGHNQQPGPPLPASPTLTNPDMILPDYERSDSPDPDLSRADHSSLMMWNSAHGSMTGPPDIHQMFVATGLAAPRPYGPAGPVTPTTPIIYGNGTMLSDIGEVTEVESTVGKLSPPRLLKPISRRPGSPKPASGSDQALRSSPTMGTSAVSKKKSRQSLKAKRERRSSTGSDSTVTTEARPAVFADFDDSVSVGDSVFQGDDEESMASSYVEGTPAVEPALLGVARVENIDRLSTYSTTSLSRRAEEILANAKKKLTTMEGNLTRARSSLHYNGAYGSDDGSTPSPPFQRAATATYQLESAMTGGASPPDHAPGHARMSSDVAMRNGLPYRVSFPRSQSALGAAGGYRQPLTASRSADYIRADMDDESQRPVPKANSVRESGLKPLTEDEVARLGEADSESQHARLEAFLSPTFGSFQSDNSGARNLQRSSSAAQMRDIKDQMRDLKGKISSLREQARVDNMKRRSLQSLRTPSPFTHSQIDQWYAEPRSNRTSEIITSNVPGRNPWNGEESSVDGGEAKEQSPQEHAEGEETDYFDAEHELQHDRPATRSPESEVFSPPGPAPETTGDAEDSGSDIVTQNGDADEDRDETFPQPDDADYMSESGDSLYHDTVQHQISHEDREDAFDYEHFFLHSAMGTMSLARRASSESLSSEGSVETTRGPVVADGTNGVGGPSNSSNSSDPRATAWSRRNSSNSISTIDTFATAHDGRSLKSPVSPDDVPFFSSAHGFHSQSSSRAASAQSHHRFRSASAAAAVNKRLSYNPTSGAHSRPSTAAAGGRDSDDGSISPIAEEGASTVSASPNPRSNNHSNNHSNSNSNNQLAAAPAAQPPSASATSPTSPTFPPSSLATAATATRRLSVLHRPLSTASSLHRPSVSSFESVGTNRSFPLVNKPASPVGSRAGSIIAGGNAAGAGTGGVLTPPEQQLAGAGGTNGNAGGVDPETELNTIASRLMGDMARHHAAAAAAGADPNNHQQQLSNGDDGSPMTNGAAVQPQPHPLEALLREDRYLVERLVAGLGRCVLGLTENGRASAESRVFRRRLDAARRALEGLNEEGE